MADATLNKTDTSFSFKTFGIGLAVVAVFYGGLFAYLAITQGSTITVLEERLASQTVLINRHKYPKELAAEVAELVPEDQNAEPEAIEKPEGVEIVIEGSEQELEDNIKEQAQALRAAPIEGFYEETRFGKLPIAKDKMQTPFRAYKKPFLLNGSQSYIAVAVQDFGLSKELSKQILDILPSEISVILSPYSAQPKLWTQQARADGHEVWLDVPVETADFPLSDPGAKGLLSRVSLRYNQERLHWVLGRAEGYTGIAAFSDSALHDASPMFTTLAQDMFERGLGYLEINTERDGFIYQYAAEKKIPLAHNDAVLDVIQPRDPKVQSVIEQIELTGGAVVILKPSPTNIGALKLWLSSLMKRKDIVLVPVSAVANLNSGDTE